MSFDNYLKKELNIDKISSEEELLKNNCLDEKKLLMFKQVYYRVNGVMFEKNYEYTLKTEPVVTKYCIDNKIIPICQDEFVLKIALNNPFLLEKIANLKIISNRQIIVYVATQKSIEIALKKLNNFYKSNSQIVDLNIQPKNDTNYISLFTLDSNEEILEQDTIKSLIKSIIEQAIIKEASDIHIETLRDDILIRFRIDGRLKDIRSLDKHISQEIINSIKTFSNMDITNQKTTQDGHLNYQNFDIRVNTLPNINGEKIVMRLRKNDDNIINSLSDICFLEEDLELFNYLLKLKSGLIVVTGPTGSGKSTTLASFLQALQSEHINIVSIEDPVEIIIKGVTQVNINERSNFSFEEALRGILRQDIDVLMIGELRDIATTEIAIRAALTGHTILTTLHTENSTGAIYRFIDMGVSSVMIKETVKGVIAQRLLRKLCPHCKQIDDYDFYFKAVGCDKCNYTGYKGRIAIFEILIPIIHLISADYNKSDLYHLAIENGLITLKEKAMSLVEHGITSLDELENILGNFQGNEI
ncbi:hypothetical protein AN641_03440 [Candidatus Epulonipiscioides gigas]|nr:hypothetical protein AN641_03440 [Epulopiscium sp. SCG-C07WGA-EpuloA2]